MYVFFFFSSRRRHTSCALVTGVQTCALPISTLTIKPSWQQQTRIEFGTIRLDPDTRQLHYWMRRTQGETVQQADSRTCRAMRAVIGEMKQIEPLQPDPPGFQDGDLLITADGTWYTLEGPGRYQDSHMGKFRVEANEIGRAHVCTPVTK